MNFVIVIIVLLFEACTSGLLVPVEICEFKCEKEEIPRQIRQQKPDAGRCGIHRDLGHPLGFVSLDLRLCCHIRDACYYSCGTSLAQCEGNFQDCLARTCNSEDCVAELRKMEHIAEPSCQAFRFARDLICTCDKTEMSHEMKNAKLEYNPSVSVIAVPKEKMKAVQRGEGRNIFIYSMPEHADEEEYIRNNRMPGHELRDEL